MMNARHWLTAALLCMVSLTGGSVYTTTSAAAQTKGKPGGTPGKSQTGVIKSVSGSSMTVTVDGRDVTFAIDKDTKVTARAAGTKSRAKQGNGGVAITDFLSSGDRVAVSYSDKSGTMHADNVRLVGKSER